MYVPRTVPLNIPPNKDGSERIGTHTLTVHRYGFPTYFERSSSEKCRGIRPLPDEECVPGVEQQLGNATPSTHNPVIVRLCHAHESKIYGNRKRVPAPVRVTRVDERSPVRVRGAIYAFCEFSDEPFCGCEARRGTVLQRGGEVESAIALAWFARNLDARRIVAAGTKEAPEPVERRGRDRR